MACEDGVQREVGWQGFKSMLGGERLSGTSLAHAQEMLSVGASTATPARKGRKP